MDVPGPRNKTICREGSGDDGDKISSLPNNLIEHILTFLPLREAAKTSVLSTAWRRTWVNRPSVVFDDQFWKPYPVEVAANKQLKKLRLYACAFTSSQISFEEFRMLTSLDLRWIKFPNAARVSFIIRCPLLLTFTLIACDTANGTYLDILSEAPSLSYFHCVGNFSSVCVKYAPHLKDVIVHQTASCPRDVWCSMLLIILAPNLRNLIITTKAMATQYIDLNLISAIQRVCGLNKHKASKLLKVEINQLQGVRTEMCCIQWLLAASPELHKMEIKFSPNSLPADQVQTLRDLNGFQRASSKAQIII
ncbi:unnamed protein product [Linum tenue]|uniref:F-box domain-containing protein n=1 Tax=Linum tenue TaxID=586396 RepID=A0AAV0R5Q9_9ROSI|nr:unnamed protein product [Linum tenue]